MKKTIYMRDIAKELGISIVTVSKALADKGGVSAELQKKILQVAKDMGYTPKPQKADGGGVTKNICILVPDRFINQNKSYYWQLHQLISSNLLKRGYCGILEMLQTEDEDSLVMPTLIREKKADGIIILGQVHREYQSVITEITQPKLFLDFYEHRTDIDCVVADNYYLSYLLCSYLIDNGHREIGFVGSIGATSSIQDRYLGYSKTLLEYGIPIESQCIINDRDEDGAFIPLQLPEKMPTAFICNCDEIAFNLVKTLNANGYSVPDDVSVVGFDNFIYSDICEPKITTVAFDAEAMAHVAVDIIIKKINQSSYKAGRRLITGELVIKDSVMRINEAK